MFIISFTTWNKEASYDACVLLLPKEVGDSVLGNLKNSNKSSCLIITSEKMMLKGKPEIQRECITQPFLLWDQEMFPEDLSCKLKPKGARQRELRRLEPPYMKHSNSAQKALIPLFVFPLFINHGNRKKGISWFLSGSVWEPAS